MYRCSLLGNQSLLVPEAVELERLTTQSLLCTGNLEDPVKVIKVAQLHFVRNQLEQAGARNVPAYCTLRILAHINEHICCVLIIYLNEQAGQHIFAITRV